MAHSNEGGMAELKTNKTTRPSSTGSTVDQGALLPARPEEGQIYDKLIRPRELAGRLGARATLECWRVSPCCHGLREHEGNSNCVTRDARLWTARA